MKQVTLFFLLFFLINIYGQPTSEAIDLHSGSSIDFYKIKYDGNEIFYNFSSNILYYSDRVSENYEIWILEKDKKKDRSSNSLIFRKSKLDDINKKFYTLHIIYNNEMMNIKIKNILAGVRFRFDVLYFKKGTYEIDMKALYDSKEEIFYNNKGEIVGKREHSDWQNIFFKKFPYD